MTKRNIKGQISGNQENDPGLEDLPEFLRSRPVTLLDVRPILEQGEEPFALIMQAAERVEAEQVLKLVAPFEPVPLYGVLGGKGFQHWTRQVVFDEAPAWEVYFFREQPEVAMGAEGRSSSQDLFDLGDSVREIDVRGLEPPEPLEQILEAVSAMNYGDVLLVHHHRNPLILFDMLAERDCAYRSTQVAEDYWQVRIWRRS